MKKNILLVLLLIIGVLSLTACNKKEVEKKKTDTIKASQLIGTWSYSDEGVIAEYVFKDETTGTYMYGTEENNITKNITYEIKDNKLLVTFENDTDVFESKIKLKKDDLLVVEDSFGEKLNFYKK